MDKGYELLLYSSIILVVSSIVVITLIKKGIYKEENKNIFLQILGLFFSLGMTGSLLVIMMYGLLYLLFVMLRLS